MEENCRPENPENRFTRACCTHCQTSQDDCTGVIGQDTEFTAWFMLFEQAERMMLNITGRSTWIPIEFPMVSNENMCEVENHLNCPVMPRTETEYTKTVQMGQAGSNIPGMYKIRIDATAYDPNDKEQFHVCFTLTFKMTDS